MACGCDAEQQLPPLAFAVVAGEESVANWGWFMQWIGVSITMMSYH
jgi:hypothetical protein